ncbi:MAG: AMP-binding protein [Candidatus Thiodiazotropha sp.]
MDSKYTMPWEKVHTELGITPPAIDDTPIGKIVELHSTNFSERVALRFFNLEITYSELDQYANRFANSLVRLGVRQDDVVGLHMVNIPQYIIALLAISKIGCAGSGVSPLLAPSELAYQLNDANISVLLSMDTLVSATFSRIEALPSCLKTVIVTTATDHISDVDIELPAIQVPNVYSYLDLLNKESEHFSHRQLDGDTTFMIQYTGGTTGKPKGAMLSMRNLMCDADMAMNMGAWGIGVDYCASAFPMFHVAGLGFAIYGLKAAAEILMIPDPRDIDHFCDQMKVSPPTVIAAVPALYQGLIANPKVKEIDFSRLKLAITGAAPLTQQDRHNIEAVIGKGVLSDLYGMTETSPVHVCNPRKRTKPSSVGIPVPGAETRIVDLETGTNEMPSGEAGEIITSGPHVMKGYLNRPGETANALRQWRGKTWMYSGDVGYMDEEGYVYLCDRAKDMLIVGGYKVFSVEVEDKLAELDFIASSAVIGSPDKTRPGNDVVNLFVELSPDVNADEEDLKNKITDFCRASMSPYKVPKVIKFVEAIPLTPVGKLDKKRLRAGLG